MHVDENDMSRLTWHLELKFQTPNNINSNCMYYITYILASIWHNVDGQLAY